MSDLDSRPGTGVLRPSSKEAKEEIFESETFEILKDSKFKIHFTNRQSTYTVLMWAQTFDVRPDQHSHYSKTLKVSPTKFLMKSLKILSEAKSLAEEHLLYPGKSSLGVLKITKTKAFIRREKKSFLKEDTLK